MKTFKKILAFCGIFALFYIMLSIFGRFMDAYQSTHGLVPNEMPGTAVLVIAYLVIAAICVYIAVVTDDHIEQTHED